MYKGFSRALMVEGSGGLRGIGGDARARARGF